LVNGRKRVSKNREDKGCTWTRFRNAAFIATS